MLQRAGKILLAIAALLPGCSVFGIRDTPQPDYQTVKSVKANDIEIRQYEPMLIAKTPVNGMDKGTNTAFRRLANYIFGQNTTKTEIGMTAPVVRAKQDDRGGEKIGMTAPVYRQQNTNGQWEMSFVMPSRYTMETIPKPVDPKITLEKIPARTVAVLRFSGFLNKANVDEKTRVLKKWVERSPYRAVSSYRNAGYDPPLTIPFLRRNEILVDVALKN